MDGVPALIYWLNGPFGAGKTTTSRELVKLLPDAHLFDPETVGFLLKHVINEPVDDFQHWAAWRALVVETAVQLLDHWNGPLVVPMTLLREPYAKEIFDGLAARGVDVRHLVLHATAEELTRRIENDQVEAQAKGWRLQHLESYEEARGWLGRTAEVIDTTGIPATEVAARIVSTRSQP
ncbi:AAA family ATPase [Nonomuraea sp. NPDC050556]|uniref:AAA family ATPase n=1 Tax=Nonomuraea sp. NPDC050556 TaxID=3364369 RepID=UPI00379EBC2A